MQDSLHNKLYNRIIDKVQQIIPVLEDITIVYKLSNELVWIRNNEKQSYSLEQKLLIQNHRFTSNNFQWIRPEDFLSINNDKKIRQLDLLDEYENRALILYFQSENDSFKNFVALTFPKEISFLGLHKTVKNLSADDKNLIGEIFHRFILTDLESELQNIRVQQRISKYYELKSLSSNAMDIEMSISYLKELFLNEFINSLNKIIIDNQVIKYIIDTKLKFDFALICMRESINFSKLMNDQDEILIDLISFKLIVDEKLVIETPLQNKNTVSDKINELLDRYELAAQKAESLGYVVNGKTLAENLNPKVSPPAITDSIKKNASKIEKILKENPSKWKVIRKNIKPIRELDSTASILQMII
jgi:hypothetical protein